PVQLHPDPLEFLLHCEESGGLWCSTCCDGGGGMRWSTRCSICSTIIPNTPQSTPGRYVPLPLGRLFHHTHTPPRVLRNLHIPAEASVSDHHVSHWSDPQTG
ncbi:hypothetical protein AALO_G00036580, partial [Alosa alosa]